MIKWERFKDPIKRDMKRREQSFNDYDDEEPGVGPVMMTPMGVMPINEDNLASNKLNLWTAHTDFRVTKEVARLIESANGVEALRVVSPYRFTMGVGRLFKENDVKDEVEGKIFSHLNPPKPLFGRKAVFSVMSLYPAWQAFRMPKGRWEFVAGEDETEVETRGNEFVAEAKKVYSSWRLRDGD